MPRLLVALALLAMPAAAIAKAPKTNAPPGNSAIDQYLETVPDAGGASPPRPPAGGGSSAGALTAAQRARLDRLGPDGRTLVAAVDATSPARSTSSGSGTGAPPRRAARPSVRSSTSFWHAAAVASIEP
jgi:hypothetical protein